MLSPFVSVRCMELGGLPVRLWAPPAAVAARAVPLVTLGWLMVPLEAVVLYCQYQHGSTPEDLHNCAQNDLSSSVLSVVLQLSNVVEIPSA